MQRREVTVAGGLMNSRSERRRCPVPSRILCRGDSKGEYPPPEAFVADGRGALFIANSALTFR